MPLSGNSCGSPRDAGAKGDHCGWRRPFVSLILQTFEVAAKHLPRLILDESSWRVASGSFVVGEHNLTEYVPHLLEALERKNHPDASDPLRAKRAILDALLRLDAEVPATLLATEKVDAELGAVTYLLLARDVKANAAALRRLHDALSAGNAARWASACALTKHRDTHIAERLLAATPWHVELLVEDPGNETFGGRMGGGGHWMTPHGSWPPRVTYHLDLPTKEEPLFPVKYLREESQKSGKNQQKVYGHNARELRVRMIDELLGKSRFAGRIQDDEFMRVTWTDQAAYAPAVRSSFLRFRALLRSVADSLKKEGLLSEPEVVANAISFSVQIHDKRTEPEPPLPEPPKIDGVTYK